MNQTLQAYLQVLKNVIVEVHVQAWRSALVRFDPLPVHFTILRF